MVGRFVGLLVAGGGRIAVAYAPRVRYEIHQASWSVVDRPPFGVDHLGGHLGAILLLQRGN